MRGKNNYNWLANVLVRNRKFLQDWEDSAGPTQDKGVVGIDDRAAAFAKTSEGALNCSNYITDDARSQCGGSNPVHHRDDAVCPGRFAT